MTTKLTLEDLGAMRQHYGIAQEEEQAAPSAAASRRTYDLLEDLGQVGVLKEVGISLQRWAQLRDVPMEYAEALRESTSTRKSKTVVEPADKRNTKQETM